MSPIVDYEKWREQQLKGPEFVAEKVAAALGADVKVRLIPRTTANEVRESLKTTGYDAGS